MTFKMFRHLIFLVLLALAAEAQSNLVPYWFAGGTNSPWTRDDYQWDLSNIGRPDNLYSNGVFVSSEPGGDYDLNWFPLDCSGVKVGIVESDNAHLWFAESVIFGGNNLAAIASNAVPFISLQPYNWPVSNIVRCVDAGCRVINLAWGVDAATFGLNNLLALSNACLYAEEHGVIICCAAPNTGDDLDVVKDYPGCFTNLWNVFSITTATREGKLYQYGVGAHGSFVIGAPGRNVMGEIDRDHTQLVYVTATSFACAHATGAVAFVMAEKPELDRATGGGINPVVVAARRKSSRYVDYSG